MALVEAAAVVVALVEEPVEVEELLAVQTPVAAVELKEAMGLETGPEFLVKP